MSSRATIVAAVGMWAMALSAQTPPLLLRFPGVPQFTAAPKAPVTRAKTVGVVRELGKYEPGETAVCSIPLREVPVANNVERMPVWRPPAEPIDHMPLVKLPAPPCQEDKR